MDEKKWKTVVKKMSILQPAVCVQSLKIAERELKELNLGWAKLQPHALAAVCQHLLPTLIRLNFYGMARQQLTDEVTNIIYTQCSKLQELDLSDCGETTGACLSNINALKQLRKLSLNRCYGIDPLNFLSCKHIDELKIFGCVIDDGIHYLRERLDPTKINVNQLQ